MKQLKVTVLLTMLVVLIAALAISGCTSPTPTAEPTAAPTETPVAGPVALAVLGSVSNPLNLTLDDLMAYEQFPVNETTTNSAGITTEVNGTGPSLNAVLNASAPLSTAMNITFKSSDYSKTIALSVVTGSPNATIIIFSDGSLRDVIPGQGAGAWVSNLTTIEIS